MSIQSMSNSKESFVISAGLKANMSGKYEAIALECEVSEKTIQRAVRGEPVSSQTVSKIARGLKVSLHDLVDPELRTCIWVLARKGNFKSLNAVSFFDTLAEPLMKIINEIQQVNREIESEAFAIDITDSRREITIKAKSKHVKYEAEWTLRPARMGDNGVMFEFIIGWNELDWSYDQYSMILSISDDVTLNGLPYISKVVSPGWRVVFINPDEPILRKRRTGEQHFGNDADFRDSFNQFLESCSSVSADFDLMMLRLIIDVESDKFGKQQILIERACFGPGGNPFKASFNRRLATRMLIEIGNSESRKIECLYGSSNDVRPFGPCEKSVLMY